MAQPRDHHWLVDVLVDLQQYATQHQLLATDEMLSDTLFVAVEEISRVKRGSSETPISDIPAVQPKQTYRH